SPYTTLFRSRRQRPLRPDAERHQKVDGQRQGQGQRHDREKGREKSREKARRPQAQARGEARRQEGPRQKAHRGESRRLIATRPCSPGGIATPPPPPASTPPPPPATPPHAP